MDIAGSLGANLGPLPVWAWAGIGGGALALASKLLKPKTTAAPGGPITLRPASGDSGTAMVGGSYGFPVYDAVPTGGGVLPPATTPAAAPAQPNAFPGAAQFDVPHELAQKGTYNGGQQPFLGYGPGLYVDPQVGGLIEYAPAFGGEASKANLLRSLGTPATLPVGDMYGAIGMLPPEVGAAGGYYGPGGRWVATPTPWNPDKARPPMGTLAPGTPYTTGAGTPVGMVPDTGAIVGAPVQYQQQPAGPQGTQFDWMLGYTGYSMN